MPGADQPAAPAAGMLLVLDCAYSYDDIRARGLEHVVTQLDLEGFFEHVWHVHPLLGASSTGGSVVGRSRSTPISGRHTMIEAPIARYRCLRRLPALNLLVAQGLLLARLSRLVARHPVRVIAVADPFFLGLWGMVLATVHRVPLVVKVNANYDAIRAADGSLAYPRLIRRRWLEDLIVRLVLSRADRVTVGSDDNLRYVQRHGACRVAMVPTGDMFAAAHLEPPEDRPSVAEEVGLAGRPFLVFVGRLEPSKHPEAAVAALAALRPAVPGIALVVVGDGSMRPDLEEQARALGVGDDVRFVGTQDQRWIARALSSAAVVVCPYSGLVLVEAALSGTPVVGFDIEWHAELISSGETGILVPYRDIAALARAIEGLLHDPVRAEAMAEAARRHTLEEMSPAAAVGVKRSMYSVLLAAPDGEGPGRRRGRRRRTPAPRPRPRTPRAPV